MLDALGSDLPVQAAAPPRPRRLRRARRAGSWLLLAGWIVLPLMPVLAIALSVLLGLGVS